MAKFLRKLTLVLGLSALLAPGAFAEVENPLFGYTHMLPGPFTIPAGKMVYGTDIGLGVTNFFQVGTNVISDFYQVYNVSGKISLIDYPEFAAAFTLGYQSYNYHDISPANPDLRVSSWLPGVVTAIEVLPSLAWFVGGNLNYTNATLVTNNVETSGYVRGASVESDVSWAYNPRKTKKGSAVGNVLSAGVSYDLNYQIYGLGISHHWPGFHLGVHYYPNASLYKVQPILAGGGVVEF